MNFCYYLGLGKVSKHQYKLLHSSMLSHIGEITHKLFGNVSVEQITLICITFYIVNYE